MIGCSVDSDANAMPETVKNESNIAIIISITNNLHNQKSVAYTDYDN